MNLLLALYGVTCATCHPDVAAQWAQSAHRFSSFNNPYYRASANAFRRERGERGFAFCARCHDPALIAAGAIGQPIDESAPPAQAGITCLHCHSVTDVHKTRGNGEYTLTHTVVPPPGPAHDARVRPPILAEARFCASCHKVALTPEVTHDIWLRGQDDYDPWQMSAIAGQGAGAVRRPAATRRCQDCHMPPEAAPLGDRAAKGGVVLSHRFLAANSALPALRGDDEAAAHLQSFLRGALSVDVVARRDGSGDLNADVVLRNRKVGHRFPGGVGDSNEAWIEVEVLAPSGQLVAHAGWLDGRSDLAPDAHLIRAQPVDGDGRPIARRDPQHMRGVAYDTSVGPSDPQVVRYRLERAPPGPLRVRARVRYRQFSADYARFACAEVADAAARARCLDPPAVEVASVTRGLDEPRDWEAWCDHGLGLADGLAEQAREALPSLERARALAPARVEPLIGLIRLALAEGRTADVLELSAQAERMAPDHPAPLWLRVLALERAYRHRDALPALERLVELLPEDRGAWLLLGRARSVAGDAAGALAAAERVLSIDDESYDGHHLAMLALRALGRGRAAERAQRSYLHYRRRHERDLALREKFRRLYPERAQESFGAHEHPLHRVPEGLAAATPPQ